MINSEALAGGTKMNNYCMEALRMERKKTTSTMLITFIIILSIQVFSTTFLKATLQEGYALWMMILFYCVIFLITISIQLFLIIKCIKKWINAEHTDLVKSIRSQLPAAIREQELDYIFDVLNSDFERTQHKIGKYFIGNEWFIGMSYRNEYIAIPYNNIQKFKWETVKRGSGENASNIKGLVITCINPSITHKFTQRKSFDVYLYLKEMLPSEEFVREDARTQATALFQALKDAHSERKSRKDK